MNDHQASVQKLSKLLLSGNKNTKVIFMVGAGISTSCGIPDFRSPKTGLYDNLSKLNLPYAEAVFDIEYYENNPHPFYLLAKELYPGNFKPSKFHYLMKLFESKGYLHRIYTQNIDTLELMSEISKDYIVEAHGSFGSNHCIKCRKDYEMSLFKDFISEYTPKNGNSNTNDPDNTDDIQCLRCEICDGLIKPKIVFFGENLPSKFFRNVDKDLKAMSKKYRSIFKSNTTKDEYLVIVAGTSLTVQPFASLPNDVPEHVQRVLVNLQKVGDFAEDPRKTDIFIQSTTDEFAQNLIDELNWNTEFNDLLNLSATGAEDKTVENDLAPSAIDSLAANLDENLNISDNKNDKSLCESNNNDFETNKDKKEKKDENHKNISTKFETVTQT